MPEITERTGIAGHIIDAEIRKTDRSLRSIAIALNMDERTLSRSLGRQKATRGYTQAYMRRSTATRIVREIGVDPIDVGL